MAAVSLAEAKAHLNITASTYDTELTAFIDRAESALAGRLGGPISTASGTETYDGGGTVVQLRRVPVVSVAAVTQDAVAITDYALDPSAGLLYRDEDGASWEYGVRNISVTYTAGYSTVPDALKQALLELVRHLWKTQRGGMDGRNPMMGDETVAGTGWTFPLRVEQLLDPYREPGF